VQWGLGNTELRTEKAVVDLKRHFNIFIFFIVTPVIFLNGHGLFSYFPLRWEK